MLKHAKDVQVQPTSFLKVVAWAVAYAATVVPLLLFVLSLLGRYFYLCELIGNFRAYIFVMLIPCGVLLWCTKKRIRSLLFAAATLWSSIGVVTPMFPHRQPSGGEDVVKIMSFNVLGTNEQFDSVINRIREHDPDLITVLEYANRWSIALRALDADYPHQILSPRWHGFGIAIFSKRPISNSTTTQITREITDNPLLTTEVEIEGQPVQIAGLHLMSPMNRGRLEIRNQQLNEVASILAQRKIPTIVMGDFNCTPWSPFLTDFLNQTGLRDSRSGFGYQASWSAVRAFLKIPIDHAFVSPQVRIHQRQLGAFAGSDHYPLIFEVSVTPQR